MNNFQIGDIVALRNDKNFYGFIIELRKHHYGDKFYYTVLWFNTGYKFKYALEEIIKVCGNETPNW